MLGDDALACLKDLRRWLKLYDTKLERYDVKRCLAEANLVKGDLLGILAQWKEGEQTSALRRKIAIGCLELLTELTWPFELDNERTTVNHHRHLPYLQLAQIDYKRAVLQYENVDILRKAIAAGVESITTPRRDRTPRDEGIVNLLLYFLRNIAMISQPQHLPSNGDENEISRSATIDAFHAQDVLQLILAICSSMGDEFQDQDVIVLELLFHLLKGVDPRKIFREDKQVVSDNMKNFKDLLQKEKAMFAGQAKNAPTRHNRFGTMIWVKRPDEKVSTLTGQDVISSDQKTLEKMDSTKQWNPPRGRGKKVEERPGEVADFVPVPLEARARKHLRSFVADFLDSSFNPLFTHLRRAIEREADRVKETHSRQFFYLISWFLKAEEARREAGEQQLSPLRTATSPVQAADTSFAYIAGVLTQENFVLLNRTMQRCLDDKSWQDLHTCMLSFTQIMLTVSAMAESPSDDDQEIAENIQSRIFYEEQTHDRVIAVIRSYKENVQGFGYLDACTEMAHVFLRMLERYSKVNVDMYIRSKRRARKKAQAKPKGEATVEGLEDDRAPKDDNGENDQVEAHREVQERKFDFGRFAARFINESCIDTFVALAGRYNTINADQLKRCHRFFYRVAFKMDRAILLFRVDILNLFNRMIKGPNGLDIWLEKKSEDFKEWEELVKQVFRRCIRKIDETPAMMVEMLFTKIPNSLFYLEHGYDKEVIKSVPRAPAELEVKPGMSAEEQLGVAVSVLVNQSKLDTVAWLKQTLESAAEERRSWEDQQTALESISGSGGGGGQQTDEVMGGSTDKSASQNAPEEDGPKAPSIIVVPDSAERKLATFKDKHLRLVLKLLSFQRLGANDDPDASWIVPSDTKADQLMQNLDLIRKVEYDPPVYEDGKSAESFIRNVLASRRSAVEKETSDEDGDSDIDEDLFVPGGPTMREDDGEEGRSKKRRKLRRKGKDITEEERARRANERSRREREKDAKVKSSLFVTESDDEDNEEQDAHFFRLEAERRGLSRGAIKQALMQGRTGHGEEITAGRTKKTKRKTPHSSATKQKRRKTIATDDEDESMSDEDNTLQIVSSRESSEEAEVGLEMSSELGRDADVETPLSSQNRSGPEFGTGPNKAATILAETSGNRGSRMDESDEEDVPVVKSSRRSGRMPFIIVDDDSD